MKQTLIKSLSFESGTIYSIAEQRRIPLAYCKPTLELYEYSTTVSILGRGCEVKKHSARLIVCDDVDTTRDITPEYLQKVTGFEVDTEIQGEDGIFRKCHFNNLIPVEINLDDTWTFEVTTIPNEIKKLLKL